MFNNKLFTALILVFLLLPTISHALEIEESTVSPDGKLLAIAYDDNTISVFSLDSGLLLQKLQFHTDSIQTINFNHDGSRLLSGSWGDYVVLWNVQTGNIIKKKKMPDTVMHAFFAANDENIILSIDETGLLIYDSKLSKKLKSFYVNDNLQTSKNKQLLVGQNGQGVSIVNLDAQELLFDAPEDSYDNDMYFSDDNKIVVIRDWSSFHVWSIINQTKLHTIDALDYADLGVLRAKTDELWIGNNNKIEIHNYLTNKSIAILSFEELDIDEIQHITFSENSSQAAITAKLNDEKSLIILIDTKSYEIKQLISPKSYVWPGAQFIQDDILFLRNTYPSEVWQLSTKEKKFNFSATGTQ